MQKPRVHVLRGGPSHEYYVSLKTGQAVLEALQQSSLFEPHDIVITQSGEWLVDGIVKRPRQALAGSDVVFNALHGAYGEDGTIQRELDRLAIPYTGSKAFAAASAFDKHLAKQLLNRAGLRTPPGARIKRSNRDKIAPIVQSLFSSLGSTIVIKPNRGGSSQGVTVTTDPSEAANVIAALLETHDDVLVEQYIAGREATVGVINDYRSQPIYVLPPIEIGRGAESFFSEHAKYDPQTERICPGRFSTADKRKLEELASLAHRVLGAEQYSRADFIVTPQQMYLLEVNTHPGLTSNSLLPFAFSAVGGSYRELIETVLLQRLGRY